jgi:2-methylcitrate dehydratase PrpD
VIDLSRAVAEHVAGATFDSLPDAAVSGAKRSLLDALGVTLAASTLGEGIRPFVDLVVADGGTATSTVVGFGVKVPAAAAAFANGAMAHALDYEDAHDGALVHPSAPTVPAVLALAESRPTTGEEVLTALAVGTDLVCRLGLALRSDPAERGWYPPVLLQAFGAAASASRLLGLDATATLDALSLTLAQVTGTSEMTRGARSVVRGVRDAFGAQAGVRAAQLAAAGVAGFDQPFEGEAGLYALYSDGLYEPAEILDDLGRRYEGARLTYKPWPSCRGTHAAIEAALLMRADGLVADDIVDVLVVGAPLNRMLCVPVEQRRKPTTAIDAKFSLPFTVGRAIVHGEVGLDAFTPGALRDPAVLAVAQRVRYQVDPDDSPGAVTRCRLEVRTGSGTRSVVVDPAPGGPDRPMSDGDLRAKFVDNASHSAVSLADDQVARIVDVIAILESCVDIDVDLMAHLRPSVV